MTTNFDSFEFIERDVLVIRHAFDYGEQLIETAQSLSNLWQTGDVASERPRGYDAQTRRCKQMLISGEAHPSLERFEAALFGTIGAALQLYVERNPFVLVTDDYGYHLVKYEVGDFFKPHADSRPGETVHSGRRVSILAYPNDGYEGGELNFVRHGVSIKPSAGSIVLFPSFFTHPHESAPITKGTKYTITGWLY